MLRVDIWLTRAINLRLHPDLVTVPYSLGMTSKFRGNSLSLPCKDRGGGGRQLVMSSLRKYRKTDHEKSLKSWVISLISETPINYPPDPALSTSY